MEKFIFSQKEKKFLKRLPLLLAVFAFIIISFWLYVKFGQKTPANPPYQTPSQNSEIQRQLRELETLRGEAATFTAKETQTQIKELKTLRKKTKPLSKEEVQDQLNELNKLRSQ